jgi:hypothetical protein
LEPDAFGDRGLGETSEKIVTDIISGQVRGHGIAIEMLLERVIRVFKTLFGGIGP